MILMCANNNCQITEQKSIYNYVWQWQLALLFVQLARIGEKHVPTPSLSFPFVITETAVSSIPRRIPVREFFRNPEQGGFKISPDGKSISMLKPFERRMNVHVQSVSELATGSAPRQVTSERDRDIVEYWWKGNNQILYLLDSGGDENFHLFGVDLNGGVAKDLTPLPGVRAQVVDELIDKENEILVALNHRNPELFDVYHLDLLTGELKMIVENPGGVMDWLTDHDGVVRVGIVSDGVNRTMLYRETENDAFKEVITTHFRDTLTPIFFTFDNTSIFAASNLGRDKEAIVIFDPRTGKEVKEIFAHPEVDVDLLSYSWKRKVPTIIHYTTWKRERHYLDSVMRDIVEAVTAKLPGYEVLFTSHNDSEDVFIIRTYSDRSLGAFFMYEVNGNKLTKLADVSPWLDENDMVEMKPVSFTSRDGLTIHGYLALPKGRGEKNLPVVINPHGGPWVRDRWGYNPEMQLFANRGYAVFQMNYRGSTGYGKKFWEASFKQWGKKMQDDLTDGVHWLIEQGIADKDRVAIYGGSYGGYATLAGVAFTPDLYACAIDYVGVSNLFTFIESIPPYWRPMVEMMYEMVGHPVKDKELLREGSPVYHADKITTPLMVIQGAKDPRVNIDESNQIVEALRSRGVDVPYIVKENEGHGFRNEENRFEVYEAMEVFLAKHLGE
jgi:dipeptidyl aminopeptidase/acylaminoacyl peptidase